MLTFLTAWNDFFWPIIVLSTQNPTIQVSFQSLATGYAPQQSIIMAGTLYGTVPGAHRLRLPRPPDRRRHHAGRGQGMTATNEALELATRLPSTFVWGAATSALPDRGRRRRGRQGPLHLGRTV